MDNTSLDDLLLQRRRIASAGLPPNFQQNVRREIRLRSSSQQTAPAIFPVWQWLLRPQFVTVALVLSMFVGIGVGSRRDSPDPMRAQQALNLDVFAAAAPALPSTLLSSNL